MTWNGTTITGPVLIYHDEVLIYNADRPPFTVGDPNRPGALVCRSTEPGNVAWIWPHGFFVVTPPSERDFQQVRTENNNVSLLYRNASYTPEGASNNNRNGLWNCTQGSSAVPVGLFRRGQG